MGDQGPTPPIWLLPEPPKRGWGLGRVDIVNAAVRLADLGGAEALTMRAVAKEMGASTPMSLYRYVHSKDGLVDLMLDLANSEVATPEVPGEDWRGELTSVAVDTWAMTKRHPWYARLVHQRPPAGPNVSRRTEFVLATFDRLGQDLSTALGYARLLDGYVTGQALQWAEERAMWQRNAFVDVVDVQRQARAWFGDLPSEDGQYPLLVRVRECFLAERHGAAGGAAGEAAEADAAAAAAASADARKVAETAAEDAQFELGLECLLDGIAARLR
ncbi:TetR/AcrR family transcriptional regulator [Amycolatopsis silviterrae]|uniref:TetR/AcrR family transcriptional regulator n=1 Tax=Amycolatopsis silviterrae TaxID=1656914 RepID=A0ABW5H7I6_9PSEU